VGPRPAPGHIQPPLNGYRGPFPKQKRPGCDDLSRPSNADIKYHGAIPLLPLCAFNTGTSTILQLLISHPSFHSYVKYSNDPWYVTKRSSSIFQLNIAFLPHDFSKLLSTHMALHTVHFKKWLCTTEDTRILSKWGQRTLQTRRHSTNRGISIHCDILMSTVFHACVGQLYALNIRADSGLYRKHVLVA
jgi:hypothetical protein